ncbi:ComF family protein [candidate division KSB1 bacterium]|nr:ComF family protein [candidate division KSB1 bacterium]
MIRALPRNWPIWDLFFPPLCAQCGRSLAAAEVWFCRQCWVDAPVSDPKRALKVPGVDMLRAGYDFHEGNLVRCAVHGLKYFGHLRLACEMSRQLVPRLPATFVEPGLTWCVVPLHWSRRLLRGFNQSTLIARALASEVGHAEPVDLLRRTRYTPSQTSRSVRERRANVKGAFSLTRHAVVPKSVLLIDDVITTGATVNECATVLKAAGAEWVGALSFALTRA